MSGGFTQADIRRVSEVRVRGGVGLAVHAARCLPDSALLQQREVKREAHAHWHFQAQLSWRPRLIASVAETGQKGNT